MSEIKTNNTIGLQEYGEVSSEKTAAALENEAEELLVTIKGRMMIREDIDDPTIYLTRIARAVGGRCPYVREGLGQGTVQRQVDDLISGNLDKDRYDCKLPTSVMAFTLKELNDNGMLQNVSDLKFMLWGASTHPRVQMEFNEPVMTTFGERRILWIDFEPSIKEEYSMPVLKWPTDKTLDAFKQRRSSEIYPVNAEGLAALDRRYVDAITEEKVAV